MSITIPFIFLLNGLLRYNYRLKSLTVVGRKRQGRRSPAGFSWSPQYFMCVSSPPPPPPPPPPRVFNEIQKNRYRFQTFQEDHVTQEITYFVTVFLFLFFLFFSCVFSVLI